jgi:tetratricopeptide (TPR) repeat protein
MHPSYADSLNNIGITYQSKGDYDKALEYKLKSIEIKKIVLG